MTFLVGILAISMGLILGLLGGGGSILSVPIFAYVVGLSAGNAIAASLVVVGLTAAMGTVLHARKGNVELGTGLLFGSLAMVGAYLGGRVAGYVPGWLLLVLFAALMLTTSLLMLRKGDRPVQTDGRASLRLIAIEGLAVGAVTGLIGAGGGFLVVPALVVLGGLPMHKAIGTSLLVIAMKSAAAVAGHLSHAEIPWALALGVAALAMLGSILGARISQALPAALLRTVFAWFVLAMGIFILVRELGANLG